MRPVAEMMAPLPPKEEPFCNCVTDGGRYYVFDQRTRLAPRDGEGQPLFFVEIDTQAGFGSACINDDCGAPTFARERVNGDFSKLWLGKRGD